MNFLTSLLDAIGQGAQMTGEQAAQLFGTQPPTMPQPPARMPAPMAQAGPSLTPAERQGVGLAPPSLATYASGALRGASQANNPIGALLGAVGGAIGAGEGVDQRNQTFRLLVKHGLPETDAALAISNPQILQAMLPTMFGPKANASFGVIGEDQFGGKRYGWIDPRNQTVTAAQPIGAGGAAASAMPDSGLSGDHLLSALDKPVAEQVKALAEGRIAFPGGFALKSPYWQRMVQLVSQYDPNFDAVNYNARAKTRNDFTSGKSAQNITSFNTAIGHLDTLDKAIEGLNNLNTMPALNGPINWAASAVSGDFQARQKQFETAKTAVTDELTRAFRGTGGNVHDIVQWESQLSSANSPQALHAAVRQAVELLRSRIEAIGDQYNKGMSATSDPIRLLSKKAQETLRRIEGGGAPHGQPAPHAAPQGAPAPAPGGFKYIGRADEPSMGVMP